MDPTDAVSMREIMTTIGCDDPLRVYWIMPSRITSLEMNKVQTGNQLIDGYYPRDLVDEWLAGLCARMIATDPNGVWVGRGGYLEYAK